MKIKITLLLLITFSAYTNASAQKKGTTAYEPPVTEEYAAQLKTQILVFVLLEEDKDYVQDLTKKKKTAELEKYQGDIKYYNDKIQATVPKTLNISKSVEFKKLTEVVDMTLEQRLERSFVLFDRHAKKVTSTRKFLLTSGLAEHNYHDQFHSAKISGAFVKDYLCHILEFGGDNAILHLNFFTKVKKTNMKQYAKNFLTTSPTEEEFTYILSQIQKEFDNPTKKVPAASVAAVPVGDILKDKTLIIKQGDLAEKCTLEAIKEAYPYPVEIISNEQYQKELFSTEPNRCLLLVKPLMAAELPMNGKYTFVIVYGQEIINEETGEVLRSIAPSTSSTGENSTDFKKNYDKVEAANFKVMLK